VFVSGRSLTIPDLIVSDHEVTRGEYIEVMGSDPSTADACDKNGNKLTGDAVLNNPVNHVNWYDALVYCNKRSKAEGLTPCYSISDSTNPDDWGTVPTSSDDTWKAATCDFEANGYRLPTEAEWEWLARGGENYKYAGSDTIDDVAWYLENTNETGTREVKTKAPNGYGLYDMSGNVWEWCWDLYGSISSSSAADGASSGNFRILRGGTFCYFDGGCQVAYREIDEPNHRSFNGHGFRVVRPSSID
jgi:formylglycine-generating enzyme required for sulfatase activity